MIAYPCIQTMVWLHSNNSLWVRSRLQQGYRSGDVVILTPYVGQLLLIRKRLEKYMTVVLSDRDLEDLPEEEGGDQVRVHCLLVEYTAY
jgi:hypothetical protein